MSKAFIRLLGLIVFDEHELIVNVFQGLSIFTASLVELLLSQLTKLENAQCMLLDPDIMSKMHILGNIM